MHYECSCGFTSTTAASFYKHLAAAKESGLGHQLTHARFSDKQARRIDTASQPTAGNDSASAPDHGRLSDAGATNAAAFAAATSWVDGYLMVEGQRDAAGQPAQNLQSLAAAPTQLRLPVSSSAAAPLTQQQQRQRRSGHGAGGPSPELEPEPQGTPRGWSLGRQRSGGGSGRPAAAAAGTATAAAEGQQTPVVNADDVELIERASGSARLASVRSTPVHAVAAAGGSYYGTWPGPGSGGTLNAQAALRLSVNAVMVGLTPWRWFGNGGSGGGGSGGGGSGGGGDMGQGGAHGASARKSPGAAAGGAGGGGEGGGPLVEEPSSDVDVAGTSAGGAGEEEEGGSSRRDGSAHQDSISASLDAVRAVQDVLMWHNPWRTTRIFGAGLYLAVCMRQLAKGHDLLQPSTALFAGCFALLLRNVVREGVASYRRAQQQQLGQQGQLLQGQGREGQACTSSEPEDSELERLKATAQLQQRVEAVLRRAALGVARYGAALVVLGAGLLSGRRAITSALAAVLLWLGMVVGELRVTSQPTFWLLCYVATFTIPAAYARCHDAMDAGVEAALRFVVRILVSGSRLALLSAAGVAALLVAVLPYNFVLRATLAGGAAFGVLLWQSEAAGALRSAAGPGGLRGAAVGATGEQGRGVQSSGGGGVAVRPLLSEEGATDHVHHE
ncbi:hypothetical protein Agub_g13673 [Astrephomene gubernaculifera]|uniref:Reticulon domain-containing protein n=1 Tax=Astrephomene gubernaculifera TaxID=47775 RepID=A0AAD3E299_9CHLO|nr:hypothetical protein Agub_g13673 [Astrephomene gubernaculifera]